MNNVIQVDFSTVESSGYVMDDSGKISGVYHEGLAAMTGEGDAFVGAKTSDGIDCSVVTTIEDMNRFCIMWLCIFDESVISKDNNT